MASVPPTMLTTGGVIPGVLLNKGKGGERGPAPQDVIVCCCFASGVFVAAITSEKLLLGGA